MRMALIYMKVFFDSLDGKVETVINIVPLESTTTKNNERERVRATVLWFSRLYRLAD